MTLPKKNRLKRGSDFTRLFSAVRPLATDHFSIRAHREEQSDTYKIAIIIPSKLMPRASARNALRRRVAAIVSDILHGHTVAIGAHAVISVKAAIRTKAADLSGELLSLMKKSGILK